MTLRVGLISQSLHVPAMIGYNRVSVCTVAAMAARSAAEFVWVGLPDGIHPAMADRLVGRVEQLPATAGRSQSRLQRELLRAERRLGLDLWHVLTDEPVPLLANRPVVLTSHGLPRWLRFRHLIRDGHLPGDIWQYDEARPGLRTYRACAEQWWRWKRGYRKAAAVIAVSEYVRWELVHKFGQPAGKITVGYNAHDPALAVPRPADELAAVRAKYNLPPRFVLAVASLAKTKNTPGLIDLAAALAAGPDPVPVVFVAPAGAVEPYTRRAGEKGLTVGRDVFFLHNIPDGDLACLYRLAAMFVNLAWEESFALPVAEAMACGTPAVVSNTTALPEVVGDGGVLVDPRDPPAVAAAVRGVLADPIKRAALSAAAVRRAAAFSWDATAEHTLGVYQSVCRRPP